jgi:hypothetical protein
MDEFLDIVEKYIFDENENELIDIVNNTSAIGFDDSTIVNYLRRFGKKNKVLAEGAININGSGGSGYYKPNISSIAGIYISQLSEIPVVKTGSTAYSGIYGSSDFFRDLGMLDSAKRQQVFRDYGFAYYDYLEMSPWKKFKKVLYGHPDFKRVFDKTVFLDYKASTYFLGITNKKYHCGLNDYLCVDNRPDCLITYYSETDRGIVDEAVPNGTIFLNNKEFQVCNSEYAMPILESVQSIKRINKSLLCGEEDGFWKEALANTCALALVSLKLVGSFEEGTEVFEKIYRERVVKNIFE